MLRCALLITVISRTAITAGSILLASIAFAGVDYQDPAGGWRYIYQGEMDPGITGKEFIDGWDRGPDPNVPPLSWGTGPVGFGGKPLPTDEDPMPDPILGLDGTWEHNQGDKWDGSAPGDPLSNPKVSADPPVSLTGKQGTSPGGAGRFVEGATDYIRIQDTGNPESHGWIQSLTDPNLVGSYPTSTPQSPIPKEPINTNRRVYFGHNILQDFDPLTDPLENQLIISNGMTFSFRARIPNSGPLDDIYLEDFDPLAADFDVDGDADGTDFLIWQRGNGTDAGEGMMAPQSEGNANEDQFINGDDLAIWQDDFGKRAGVIPWFENAPHGHGKPILDNRGMVSVVQNWVDGPGFGNLDLMVTFSLVTSQDIVDFCNAGGGALCSQLPENGGSGMGGLIMNNLDGSATPPDVNDIGSTGGGITQILEIPDEELNEWNEFWITMVSNGSAAGHIEVNIYRNGSTTPVTRNVSLSPADNGASYGKEDKPYLEFGANNNGAYGSIDLDFLSYKLGIETPTLASLAGTVAVPEPAGLGLLTLGAILIGGISRLHQQ